MNTAQTPDLSSQRGYLGLPRQRVLLVDDEADILESLRSYLETNLGVDVVTARSGTDALEAVDLATVDLVLSDYRMPGVDGIEFLRKVQERAPAVPRILVTAYPDLQLVLRAIREATIENFLIKPFDSAHLLDVVAAPLLERHAKELRARAAARIASLANKRPAPG